MQFLIQILKKHPFAIVSFILYLLLCLDQLRTSNNFREASAHINSGERVAWGEGVMYGYIFTILVGLVFAFFVLLNWGIRKEGKRFYAVLCVCTAVLIITVLFY